MTDIPIIFMGTPEFAVTSLKTLLDKGYNVKDVVTTPDKPAGRGKNIHFMKEGCKNEKVFHDA